MYESIFFPILDSPLWQEQRHKALEGQTYILVGMEFGLKTHYLGAQSRPHSTVYRGLIVTLRVVLEPITSGC